MNSDSRSPTRDMIDLSSIIRASNGDSEIVERALKEGKFSAILKGYYSDINIDSPFAFAIYNGFEDIVRLFVQNGANVNERIDHGRTALHFATKIKNQKMVELLLENAADVNARDVLGFSPLYFAIVGKGSEEIVRLLLRNGANVNVGYDNRRETALHLAAHYGKQKIVELLLENAADVNALDIKGYSPLIVATKKEFEEIVRLFLQNGANVNERIDNGETALHIATQKGNQKMVELLLENAADVNALDREGNPPLFYAIEQGKGEIVRLFLENEAEISKRYLPKEETVSHVAAKNGREKLVEEEFSRIKMEKIGNPEFFWHDILTKINHQLAILLANESLYNTLNSFDFNTQFPIYGKAMEKFLEHAKTRRNLLDLVKPNCCHIFPEKMHDCIPKILSYLSEKDLMDFHAAFCPYDPDPRQTLWYNSSAYWATGKHYQRSWCNN